MSQTVNFNVLAKKVSVDPFYSDSNIRYLENIVNDIKNGKAHFAEHELIENGSVRVINSAIYSMQMLQIQMDGEAEAAGITSDEDVMNLVKEVRAKPKSEK